jgi:hypothetical protein
MVSVPVLHDKLSYFLPYFIYANMRSTKRAQLLILRIDVEVEFADVFVVRGRVG